MIISSIKTLFKQLSRSKWIRIYFGLVVLQVLLSIPILLKTLINTNDVARITRSSGDNTVDNIQEYNLRVAAITDKADKVIYENCFYIVFELWRLWTLIDGIVNINALTILASGWFSIVSSFFNVLLIIESKKWMSQDNNPLKKENMYLQIVLSVLLFLLSVPVIVCAYKSSKVVGWHIYKKIGSSIELQQMYYRVQWIEFWLKVDIFFEVCLIIFTAVITRDIPFRIICISMAVIVSLSFVLARVSISYESHWMMFLFLFIQIFLFICNTYALFGLLKISPTERWFTGIAYEIASMVSILVTVGLCILCQINFGRGLKPFVYWFPFKSSVPYEKNQSRYPIEVGSLPNEGDERFPIDEDEEYQNDSKLLGNKEGYYINNQASKECDEQNLYTREFSAEITPYERTSMERIYSNANKKYDISKNTSPIDRIKIKENQNQNQTLSRMVMVPLQDTSAPSSVIVTRGDQARVHPSPMKIQTNEVLPFSLQSANSSGITLYSSSSSLAATQPSSNSPITLQPANNIAMAIRPSNTTVDNNLNLYSTISSVTDSSKVESNAGTKILQPITRTTATVTNNGPSITTTTITTTVVTEINHNTL